MTSARACTYKSHGRLSSLVCCYCSMDKKKLIMQPQLVQRRNMSYRAAREEQASWLSGPLLEYVLWDHWHAQAGCLITCNRCRGFSHAPAESCAGSGLLDTATATCTDFTCWPLRVFA